MDFTKGIWKHAPAILTGVGVAGVAATAVSAAKGALKAKESADKIRRENPNASWRDMLPAVRHYVPAAAIGAGTAGCIVGAHVIGQKQQAALMACCALMTQLFREYRQGIQAAGDADLDHVVAEAMTSWSEPYGDTPPWSDRKTYHLEGMPKFFESSKAQVVTAVYHLNRLFRMRGYATVNDLRRLLNLEEKPDGDREGWEEYDSAGQSLIWIDFDYIHRALSDGLVVCDIVPRCMPVPIGAEYLGEDKVQVCGIE